MHFQLQASLLEWRIASRRFVIYYHWDYRKRDWGLTLAYTKLKQKKKPTLYSTSKQHEHKITRTSTTNLPFHNLPALLPRTVVPAFAFLPDSLRSYQHSHSPFAMKIIHNTLAISALGNDTIKADTQPTYC